MKGSPKADKKAVPGRAAETLLTQGQDEARNPGLCSGWAYAALSSSARAAITQHHGTDVFLTVL